MDIRVLLFIVVVSGFTEAITYTGCFIFPAVQRNPDLKKFGWKDVWKVPAAAFNLRFCLSYCVNKKAAYAAIDEGSEAASNKVLCHCGSERAYKNLGAPFSRDEKAQCSSPNTALRTYKAIGDKSQLSIGCYKESKSDPASQTHEFTDPWNMTPDICIQYCEANGEAYANLKLGDTCTCSLTFAKHGLSTACNKPCIGSTGEMCGGDKALSVFATLALDDNNKPIANSFPRLGRLKLPQSELLLQSSLALQQAAIAGNISKQAEKVVLAVKQVFRSSHDVESLEPVILELAKQPPFQMINTPMITNWLAQKSQMPTELQPLMEKIQQAVEFSTKDLPALVNEFKNFKRNVNQLEVSIRQGLMTLQNYFFKGSLTNDILRTSKLAFKMVSAGSHCVPSMQPADRRKLGIGLESIARSLLQGPYGTKIFETNLENLQKKLKSTATKSTLPTSPQIQTAKDEINKVRDSWSKFFNEHAQKLFFLTTIKTYDTFDKRCANVPVFGKRQVQTTPAPDCTKPISKLNFRQTLAQGGDNAAKKDMEKFLQDEGTHFGSLDWSYLKGRFSIAKQLVDATNAFMTEKGLATPNDMRKIVEMMTSFQFYQSCVDKTESMLVDVCHKDEKPNAASIQDIKC